MASKNSISLAKKVPRPASKAAKAPVVTAKKGSQKQPATPKSSKPKAVKPGAVRQKPSGGISLVNPARGGVAASAAARADRSEGSKRQERQKVASNLLGEALQPGVLEASERFPVPKLQGLFAISSEQGIFVGLAAPPNTQILVRVGLAQRLPREWILPFDEGRAALGLQTMQLSKDLQAMVYLAFVPLVALGAADLLTGEQLFGGQTLTGSLVTFSVTCEYYRQAKPQALAAKLMKLEELFAQVFEKTLTVEHPLRKGFESLREQQTVARQSKAVSDTVQGHREHDITLASLSAMRELISQMPADLNDLKERFVADPQNEGLAQVFGKKLLAATRKDDPDSQQEKGQATDNELESFLTELSLLEFALVLKEQARSTPTPAKTRRQRSAGQVPSKPKTSRPANARGAGASRALS
jgi:hypothetical protein